MSLEWTDQLPLFPPASAYPTTFATAGGVHSVDDAVNTLVAAVPTDLPTSITALNDIKAKFNAHLAQATVHFTDDVSNTVVSADAADQATSETLANELKARLNSHESSGDVFGGAYHFVADAYNAVASPDAIDLPTLVALSAELQTAYTAHLTQKKQVGEQADDAQLEAIIRENYIITFHACGTARMSATDADGVVDGNLDVHGINKLAVCSNSSVKSTPKGNNSYIAYVMGLQKAKIEGASTPF